MPTGKWEDLPPEILGKIFDPLSIPDMFGSIQLVCKHWGVAAESSYSWEGVDLEDWTSRYQFPWKTDRMIKALIARSSGGMRKFSVCNVADTSCLDFISENLGSKLHTLKLPGCRLNDDWLQKSALSLVNVTYLDISYCNEISPSGLELIGRTCKGLKRLNRNMYVLGYYRKEPSLADESAAIATTMPNLDHLEFGYSYINTEAALDILGGCKKLKFLNIEGCWNVHLDEDYLESEFPQLRVLGPEVEVPSDGFRLEDYNLDEPLGDDEEDGVYEELSREISAYGPVDELD